jgi:hypothetical protein
MDAVMQRSGFGPRQSTAFQVPPFYTEAEAGSCLTPTALAFHPSPRSLPNNLPIRPDDARTGRYFIFDSCRAARIHPTFPTLDHPA